MDQKLLEAATRALCGIPQGEPIPNTIRRSSELAASAVARVVITTCAEIAIEDDIGQDTDWQLAGRYIQRRILALLGEGPEMVEYGQTAGRKDFDMES